MAVKDLPKVIRIEKKSFSSPWSITAFLKELHNKQADYYVAVSSGVVKGYIGVWCLINELHITNLAVHPNYRRQGIATYLLDFILKEAKKREIYRLTLEVRVSNKEAKQLYLKEGFAKFKVKQDYYKDNGEDAVVMSKEV